MIFDHGFGSLENQLIDACENYPPDFEKIQKLLARNIDLNRKSNKFPDTNILSQIILGYPEILDLRLCSCNTCKEANCDGCGLNYPDADGRYLPKIIALFLENGFDLSTDNGKFGAMCLYTLMYSSHDRYILDAAKLLLDAGANPHIVPFQEDWESETVLSMVSGQADAAIFVDDDPAQEALFLALEQLMELY